MGIIWEWFNTGYMVWLEGFFALTFPPWLRSIATAAVGALIAYAAWSWLHSPFLYPSTVVHQELIEVDNDETQRSIRVDIQNIGTKAAENCEAVLRFSLSTDGDVIRSFYPVPWLPRRAELVVDDEEHTTRTTIPAGRGGTIELVRQYRNGKTQIYPQRGGVKFIRTSQGDTYHREVDQDVEYAIISPSGVRDSDVVRAEAALSDEDVHSGDWEDAVLEMVVETESARPLEIEFNVAIDEDGQLTVEQRPLPLKRRVVTWMYKGLNRVRKIGG